MRQQRNGRQSNRVLTVPTGDLKANPHNPRRLFEKVDMDVLRESIKRVGILVPLTVYKEKRTGIYTILDGQRRWMCATDLSLPTVPVNEVAEPSLVQNIVTMFQIPQAQKRLGVDAHSFKVGRSDKGVKDQ